MAIATHSPSVNCSIRTATATATSGAGSNTNWNRPKKPPGNRVAHGAVNWTTCLSQVSSTWSAFTSASPRARTMAR
ncbi:hypothetical protein D3C84_1231010 [compost metagenome]